MQAMQKLTEQGARALVVSANSRHIDGIISEHDVMRQITSGGTATLDKNVDEVMVHDVFTCALDDTVTHLMAVMTDRRIRHLPVVENEMLVGIVSIGDIVKRRNEETEYEAEALRQYIATD